MSAKGDNKTIFISLIKIVGLLFSLISFDVFFKEN